LRPCDNEKVNDQQKLPGPLAELIEDIQSLDRRERQDLLIETADRFQAVPERVARRPFPESHRVQKCESQAYVWSEPWGDGLKFYFAVENPQGISAKAMAVILDETLSGRPLEEAAAVPSDIVFQIFGRELSMGKGEGLTGIVAMVAQQARDEMARRSLAGERP
jgi:cysteine desulfuration protein SufE